MESDTLYLGTIYNPEGKRIGFELSNDAEHIQDRMANIEKNFGTGYTYKLWKCLPFTK